jgi:hypothetical protein
VIHVGLLFFQFTSILCAVGLQGSNRNIEAGRVALHRNQIYRTIRSGIVFLRETRRRSELVILLKNLAGGDASLLFFAALKTWTSKLMMVDD